MKKILLYIFSLFFVVNVFSQGTTPCIWNGDGTPTFSGGDNGCLVVYHTKSDSVWVWGSSSWGYMGSLSTNLGNSDLTLTDPRTLTLSGNSLTFAGGSGRSIIIGDGYFSLTTPTNYGGVAINLSDDNGLWLESDIFSIQSSGGGIHTTPLADISGGSLQILYGARINIYSQDIVALSGSSVDVGNRISSLAGSLQLKEASANGANYTSLRSPASMTANRTLTFPSAASANGLFLGATDTLGTLNWLTPPNMANTNLTLTGNRTISTGANSLSFTSGDGTSISVTNDYISFITQSFASEFTIQGPDAVGGDKIDIFSAGPVQIGGTDVSIQGATNIILRSPYTELNRSGSGVAELRFKEDSTNGSNYMALKSPLSMTANRTMTFPSAASANGLFLGATDTLGTLNWLTPANIANTDLITSASLRTLTVATNSTFILRGQGLNSAIRLSDGTANEQVSLYSSNIVKVQSGDTLTISTDDGNSLIMYPNEGMILTTTDGWNFELDDDNELLTSNFPIVVLGGGVRMVNGSLEAGELTAMNGLIALKENSPGIDQVNILAPNSLAASYNLILPLDDGTNRDVLMTNGFGTLSWKTSPEAQASSTTARQYTLTTTATNYTVDTLTSSFLTEFTYSAGTFTYTGTSTRRFEIKYTLSVSAPDCVLTTSINKNSAGVVVGSESIAAVGTSAGFQSISPMSGVCFIDLATTNNFKLQIQSDQTGTVANIRKVNITIIPID